MPATHRPCECWQAVQSCRPGRSRRHDNDPARDDQAKLPTSVGDLPSGGPRMRHSISMSPPPSSPFTFGRAVEVGAALLAIVAYFGSWKVFQSSIERGLAAAVAILVLLTVTRFDQYRRHSRPRHLDWPDLIVAGALVGVIVALATISLRPQNAPTSRGPAAGSLRFHQPPTRSVPRCNVFDGSGTVPPHYSLLVFDRGVDANNQPTTSEWFLDGPATPTDKGWNTPQVDAGEAHVEIAGVLVPTGIADFLHSVVPVDGQGRELNDGTWVATLLPLGEQVKPSIFIDPDLKGSSPCS